MPDTVRLNPCRHLFTDGRQCGSPALRGEPLCYHHHTARQPIPSRSADGQTTPQLPAPNDFHAIQRGIGEVLRLLANEEINDRRAASLFRGLSNASQNLARARREDQANRASLPVTDLVNHPTLGSLALPPTLEPDALAVHVTPIPAQQNQDLSPSDENCSDHLPGAPSLTASPSRAGSPDLHEALSPNSLPLRVNDEPRHTPPSTPPLQASPLREASPDPQPTPGPQDLPPVPTPTLLFTPHPTMPLADELRFGELYTQLEAVFLEKTRRFEEEKALELETFYEDQYQQRYDELLERQAQQKPQLQLAS